MGWKIQREVKRSTNALNTLLAQTWITTRSIPTGGQSVCEELLWGESEITTQLSKAVEEGYGEFNGRIWFLTHLLQLFFVFYQTSLWAFREKFCHDKMMSTKYSRTESSMAVNSTCKWICTNQYGCKWWKRSSVVLNYAETPPSEGPASVHALFPHRPDPADGDFSMCWGDVEKCVSMPPPSHGDGETFLDSKDTARCKRTQESQLWRWPTVKTDCLENSCFPNNQEILNIFHIQIREWQLLPSLSVL